LSCKLAYGSRFGRAQASLTTQAYLWAVRETEFTIAHNVASKAEVDAVMEQARRAGAVIVKPAHDAFWGGYSGYFQDPDQHLWEIAWNPEWVVHE
jgi:uncharacterized glyoxalase superfamily protein PhnB